MASRRRFPLHPAARLGPAPPVPPAPASTAPPARASETLAAASQRTTAACARPASARSGAAPASPRHPSRAWCARRRAWKTPRPCAGRCSCRRASCTARSPSPRGSSPRAGYARRQVRVAASAADDRQGAGAVGQQGGGGLGVGACPGAFDRRACPGALVPGACPGALVPRACPRARDSGACPRALDPGGRRRRDPRARDRERGGGWNMVHLRSRWVRGQLFLLTQNRPPTPCKPSAERHRCPQPAARPSARTPAKPHGVPTGNDGLRGRSHDPGAGPAFLIPLRDAGEGHWRGPRSHWGAARTQPAPARV